MIQFPIIKDLDELVDLRIKDLKMFSLSRKLKRKQFKKLERFLTHQVMILLGYAQE
ncbi:MAG: hypothetical protein ACLSBH_09965 [Coprobacillus cateniformis]